MDLETVVPYVGLGDLRFGSTRATVDALLGGQKTSFHKDLMEPTLTDAYDELRFHLYYDEADQLEFIESFPPANPRSTSIRLLSEPLPVVLQRLADLGYTTSYSDEGYDFIDLGLGLYVPDEERIEAVSLFRRGYYD